MFLMLTKFLALIKGTIMLKISFKFKKQQTNQLTYIILRS